MFILHESTLTRVTNPRSVSSILSNTEDGMPKTVYREPTERPRQSAKLLKCSTYITREPSSTFSHLNNTWRSWYNFQPSTQTQEQYTSISTAREFIDQRISGSLIHKNSSSVKTNKTRFEMSAYQQTATRTQRIYVYMTVYRTSTNQEDPRSRPATKKERGAVLSVS